MKIPLHSKLRKSFRKLFYKVVSKKQKNIQTFIDKNEIKSIIIIRPNYRIGNIIFLTPLINELQKELPNAKIDILVGMKLAGDILKPMPNVNNIFDIPRDLLKKPTKLYKFIKNIQQTNYDLAINISAGSVSSEIATALTNAKYKASFYNEKSFINLTHIIKKENLYKHTGSKPLEFLKLFNTKLPTQDIELDIKLTDDEIKTAKEDLENLVKNKNAKTIVLFRNARFDKKIPDEWWQEWYEELMKIDSSIVIIDILSPDILVKLNKDVLEYSNKNLRLLGAFFKASNLYISADTGPLHLSTASKSKTLALFNKTSIEKFGTVGDMHKTLDINNLTPKDVAIFSAKFC